MCLDLKKGVAIKIYGRSLCDSIGDVALFLILLFCIIKDSKKDIGAWANVCISASVNGISFHGPLTFFGLSCAVPRLRKAL